MKNKILGFGIASIFVLVFLMSFASGATLSNWPLTSDGVAINVGANVNAGTFTSSGVVFNAFGINGANAEDWSLTNSLNSSKYFRVIISPQSGSTLTISDISFDYSASIAGPASFELQYSKQSGFSSPTTLITKTDVSSTGASSSNSSLNIQISSGETLTLRWFGYNFAANTNEFRVKNLNIQGTVTTVDPQEILDCSENPGKLEIKKIDFNNDGFSGREFGSDDEWFFLDEIEVEIEVENDGDWDVDDISLEWGIYDLGKQDWVIDLDEEDEFNLKDGDEETLIINFKLDDDLDLDFDEIEGNYRFYVIATGTIDDSDAGTFDDEGTCAFDFEDAEAIIESDFVVLDNIDFPEQIQCGETIEVTADVWNTGNRDQEDVSVFITNKELGLRGDILIGDIDEFDGQKLSFTFTIPRDATEKTYALTFEVYDEDNDIYENDFDDDLSRFTFPLTVEGNCGMGVADVIISANLESEAKAGKDLVIKATITNNEDELKTFTVNAAGFAQWASSYNVDRTSLVLNAGESADVLFTFDVNKDASGSQSFTIELLSGDNQITTQPVSVVIEGKSGLLSSITTGNTYLWGIGILNIVLIVIIILVAVRIARRK